MLAVSRFPQVLDAQLALLVAHTPLVTLLGGPHVYERMSTEKVEQIPSVQWSNPSAGETENYEDLLIRWDIWARGTANDAWAIENAMRAVLHKELSITLAGAVVFTRFTSSSEFPGSKRLSISRRVVDQHLLIFRHRT